MDDAERGVAVLHRVGEDAQGKIVDLVDRDSLALEFLVKRNTRRFKPTLNTRGNSLPEPVLDW